MDLYVFKCTEARSHRRMGNGSWSKKRKKKKKKKEK